jgi:hypothetical protein
MAVLVVAVGCGAPPPRAVSAVSRPLFWSACPGANDDSAVEVALVAPSGERVTVGELYQSCHVVMVDGDPAISCDDVHSDRRAVARVIRRAGTIAVVRVEMRLPIVEDDDPARPPPPLIVEQTTVGTLRLPQGTAIDRESGCDRVPNGR